MTTHVFFRLDPGDVWTEPPRAFAVGLTLWRPTLARPIPSGLPLMPFGAWALFHFLHVFANRDYALMLARDSGPVIHRSCVFPRWFRFPQMAPDDLQIGDTASDPQYRGRGLAAAAIAEIVREMARPGRRFWYICEESNVASIRAVEKVGFRRVGRGWRRPRFGLSILGTFSMEEEFL